MKKIMIFIMIASLAIGMQGCSGNAAPNNGTTAGQNETVATTQAANFENPNYVAYVDVDDIIRDTTKLGGNYGEYYNKYIDYIAPNGKPIRIVAADKVTDEQMLKAYNVLSFYLSDTKDYSKTAVANAVADKGAVLNMPNGADGDGNMPDAALIGQPLYQMETPVAGGAWYQQNDYSHRDASYEEIFHMVHDYGIGTTQNPGALPELSQKIKSGLDAALPKDKADWGGKGLWGLGSKDWLISLSKEGSLEQEYIVSGIDSFYGLWEAYTESDKGMWGMYIPKNRADVKAKDLPAYQIITSFIGENLTYMERIAPEFNGSFKMSLDASEPYTYKSQYLQNARLTGSNNSNLAGNALDNVLIGNAGNNALDGGAGNDVVQFSGASTEYTITKNGDAVTVKDNNGRDGEDTLSNIETLRFKDKDLAVAEIK